MFIHMERKKIGEKKASFKLLNKVHRWKKKHIRSVFWLIDHLQGEILY